MNESVVQELKQAIDVVSLLQVRESTLRSELDFSEKYLLEIEDKYRNKLEQTKSQNKKEIEKEFKFQRTKLIEAFRRLNHEVMFLCIDTYSLYEGIQKRKSLYTKIIKNNSRDFMKVDKSSIDPNTVKFMGMFTSDGMREFTEEEKERYIESLNEEAVESRKQLRDSVGPESHQHVDMDKWIENFLDEENLSKLGRYRKDFAHRLDSLEKLKNELSSYTSNEIRGMLNVVSGILSQYKTIFQKIIGYLCSHYYEGYISVSYDSILRIKQFKEWHENGYLNF